MQIIDKLIKFTKGKSLGPERKRLHIMKTLKRDSRNSLEIGIVPKNWQPTNAIALYIKSDKTSLGI